MEADRQAIAGGLDVARPNVRQAIALMRVLHDYVQEAISARSVSPLMEFLYPHLAQTLQNVRATGLACRAGCSHCCNSWVMASAPEVLYAIKSLSETRRHRGGLRARLYAPKR